MRIRGENFIDSPELEKMAEFIIKCLPDEFAEIKNCKYKIFFTRKDTSQRHFAGLCRKLDPAVQHRENLHYYILINKQVFDASPNEVKFEIVIHELHHIFVKRTKTGIFYQLRKHNEEEDFCELPSHDRYSREVYAKLKQVTGNAASQGISDRSLSDQPVSQRLEPPHDLSS